MRRWSSAGSWSSKGGIGGAPEVGEGRITSRVATTDKQAIARALGMTT